MRQRIVFLGDVSVDRGSADLADIAPAVRSADHVVANLEGAILTASDLETVEGARMVSIHSSPDAIEIMRECNVSAATLANNHMYDFRVPAEQTSRYLEEAGIASFGAGMNLDRARQPVRLGGAGGDSILVFGFGWDVIGCRPAADDREGVNPFEPRNALEVIRRFRREDRESFVVFVFHWNFELELYPQPAHRQLAFDLIDEGVDAIVGLHSHLAQGAEMYRGKPVVYGLGNWFSPPRTVGTHHLAFPEIANRELAVEFVVDGRAVEEVHFHWHDFDPELRKVRHLATESGDGPILRELTPFRDLPHDDYVAWFRMNRRKRKLLPVYRDYRSRMGNLLRDRYVNLRQWGIETLVRLSLKSATPEARARPDRSARPRGGDRARR